MAPIRYTLFDTPIGCCAIAWGASGLLGLQLPEADDAATRARLLRHLPGAAEPAVAPPEIEQAIAAIVALLRGEPSDLSAISLDMSAVPAFEARVYRLTRAIARGRTLSYGEVAAQLGEPAAARAVGRALGRNPFAIVVPCHRVLAAGGRMGGFSANGGAATKRRLLAIEGAEAAASLFND